eukprot:scaffold177_cov334-Pavlova_lutheri.AAC.84
MSGKHGKARPFGQRKHKRVNQKGCGKPDTRPLPIEDSSKVLEEPPVVHTMHRRDHHDPQARPVSRHARGKRGCDQSDPGIHPATSQGEPKVEREGLPIAIAYRFARCGLPSSHAPLCRAGSSVGSAMPHRCQRHRHVLSRAEGHHATVYVSSSMGRVDEAGSTLTHGNAKDATRKNKSIVGVHRHHDGGAKGVALYLSEVAKGLSKRVEPGMQGHTRVGSPFSRFGEPKHAIRQRRHQRPRGGSARLRPANEARGSVKSRSRRVMLFISRKGMERGQREATATGHEFQGKRPQHRPPS